VHEPGLVWMELPARLRPGDVRIGYARAPPSASPWTPRWPRSRPWASPGSSPRRSPPAPPAAPGSTGLSPWPGGCARPGCGHALVVREHKRLGQGEAAARPAEGTVTADPDGSMLADLIVD